MVVDMEVDAYVMGADDMYKDNMVHNRNLPVDVERAYGMNDYGGHRPGGHRPKRKTTFVCFSIVRDYQTRQTPNRGSRPFLQRLPRK